MNDGAELFARRVRESLDLQARMLEGDHAEQVARAAEMIVDAMRGGGKLVLFGNGGSAADAQHIAAEFVGRYLRERPALPALALTTNSSELTCIGNDYSFDDVFVRQLRAHCRSGDVAFGISTSGNSPNVVAALEAARELGIGTIGMTGAGGGRMRDACDVCIRFPSDETPRIQEGHTLIAHVICEIAEDALAGH